MGRLFNERIDLLAFFSSFLFFFLLFFWEWVKAHTYDLHGIHLDREGLPDAILSCTGSNAVPVHGRPGIDGVLEAGISFILLKIGYSP